MVGGEGGFWDGEVKKVEEIGREKRMKKDVEKMRSGGGRNIGVKMRTNGG